MGPGLGSLLILSALARGASPSDTSTYADRATRELVARAMARHHEQDSTVRDYRASLKYRVQFALGKRRWAQLPVAAVEEQAATLQWQYPNDIRVDLLGRRSASRMDGVDINTSFDRPWFVPRMLGDSLRVFGANTPSRAAPHPLAPGADQFYRYAAGDSLTISTRTKRVTIRAIAVTPKQAKGAFVTGRLWVDVATGDVARFTFRFVGTELWAIPSSETDGDKAAARRANEIVTRILQLDADLEYALQDDKYWMPFRQVLSGRVSVPIIEIAVPFEATTTFDDYAINTHQAIVFDAPFPDTVGRRRRSQVTRHAPDSLLQDGRSRDIADSLYSRDRAGYLARGGRYQVHRPSTDSLKAYAGWTDTLTFDQSDAERRRIREALTDVENMAEALPPEMTGKPRLGFAWEKIPDIFRYNRVQGTTLSATARTRTPLAYTLAFGTLRYGFADKRVMASVSAVRDAPGGRLTVVLGRDLADIDPFAKGLNFGNSIRGAFTGHDDGAYLLAQGGRLDFETSAGLGSELTLSALAQDQQSVSSRARAAIPRIFDNDGYFSPNAPIREGFAVGAGARLDHTGYLTRWIVAGEGMRVDGEFAGRVTGELRFPELLGGWVASRFKAGAAFGADQVPQMALRAGGVSTVRGYDFGRERGDLMWSAQVDVTRPGKGAVKKSLFLDAGQAGLRDDFGASKVLVGAGVGLSILDGRFRLELSYPITARDGRGLRFDFVFGGIR